MLSSPPPSPSLSGLSSSAHCEALMEKLREKTATIGIIGLGYVGFPLAIAFHRQHFSVIGFDTDEEKIGLIQQGKDYIPVKGASVTHELATSPRFRGSSHPAILGEADVILVCVPTPLTKHWAPDMSYVEGTMQTLATYLKPGQLVVLESTTYPGTTDELVKPLLEQGGLKAGTDFFLAYSPEREDPGNPQYSTTDIPKVVGADDDLSLSLVQALYAAIVPSVVPVKSSAAAEAVKITENIFRCVNIALVNELKMVYERMGLNIWEIIQAAATKPFGFMPCYPGPGLGGHCIPIDPFYLSWKAKEHGLNTRFIELAGEINHMMPSYVIKRLREGLDAVSGKGIRGARLLIVGLAYKKNVSDIRETPSFVLFHALQQAGGDVDYYDPHVPVIPHSREHGFLEGKASISWSAENLRTYDAALICTDHDGVDYQMLVDQLPLVVDTRNATASCEGHEKVWRA